jgi:uncharacterized peroxidase-related enzyme
VRLQVLNHGHNRRNRVALRVMRAVAGTEPDDVVKTSLYRPSFFGRPWVRLIRSLLRGQSEWTAGERELFGAFISRLNTCRYCVGVHVAATTLTLDKAMTVERLDNWREAGFNSQIAATLELLEKVTLTPDSLGPDDIARTRMAGVSDSAIVDALYICFLFNSVNRMANAFGYDWGSDAGALKVAAILNRTGYRVPGFLLR